MNSVLGFQSGCSVHHDYSRTSEQQYSSDFRDLLSILTRSQPIVLTVDEKVWVGSAMRKMYFVIAKQKGSGAVGKDLPWGQFLD